jgi:large subunit ribosomal protein L32e
MAEKTRKSPAEKSDMLKVRMKIKKKKPRFKRQEAYMLRLKKKGWRKPRGIHSKMRERKKGRGPLPNPGYGSPNAVKGLNRLGYRDVIVNNAREVSRLDPATDMAVISHSVGGKKRLAIKEAAQRMNIKVKNK